MPVLAILRADTREDSMKGMIFTALADLVETEYGMSTWNRALAQVDSCVDGAYVSAESYPAEEMQALVGALTDELGETPEALLDAFGRKLFKELYGLYPELVDVHSELVPFLSTVGSVIHEEMKILHADAEVPDMHHEIKDRRHLKMYYQSPRRLCLLAEGLIRGAAQHFDTAIELAQTACVHQGADSCEFTLRIVD
jgi:predicted hydrocarbon binding protein